MGSLILFDTILRKVANDPDAAFVQ
jgi:hypothetical protein